MRVTFAGWLPAIALLAIPQGVVADEGPRSGPPSPEMLFQRLDANKDGFLVPDELPPGLRERAPALMQKADKNNDKKLDRREFEAAAAQLREMFQRGPVGPGRPDAPSRAREDQRPQRPEAERSPRGPIAEHPERGRRGPEADQPRRPGPERGPVAEQPRRPSPERGPCPSADKDKCPAAKDGKCPLAQRGAHPAFAPRGPQGMDRRPHGPQGPGMARGEGSAPWQRAQMASWHHRGEPAEARDRDDRQGPPPWVRAQMQRHPAPPWARQHQASHRQGPPPWVRQQMASWHRQGPPTRMQHQAFRQGPPPWTGRHDGFRHAPKAPSWAMQRGQHGSWAHKGFAQGPHADRHAWQRGPQKYHHARSPYAATRKPFSAQQVFQHLDRDRDGKLSREEFAAGMARLHHHASAMKGRSGHPMAGPAMGRHQPRHPGPAPSMQGRGKEVFQKLDANKDHQISRDEAPPRLKAHFADIDRNKDGQLAPEELKRAFEAKFSQRPRDGRDSKPEGGPPSERQKPGADRKPSARP